MKYVCTLIVVRDIEQSRKFYHDLLDQEVIADFGANVTLTGGFSLQSADSWKTFIDKGHEDIAYGNCDSELYFEEAQMDTFLKKLERFGVDYVHPVKEHAWGQRVVRFYDLDQHIIEVGEPLTVVVKRFIDSGLTIAETAIRMDVPVAYVNSLLAPNSHS